MCEYPILSILFSTLSKFHDPNGSVISGLKIEMLETDPTASQYVLAFSTNDNLV